MQLRHGHVVFMYLLFLHYFFEGCWIFCWCMMHDGCLVVFAWKCRLFCRHAHSWCRVHFFHHVKFFFRFRQQIGFPGWGQLLGRFIRFLELLSLGSSPGHRYTVCQSISSFYCIFYCNFSCTVPVYTY